MKAFFTKKQLEMDSKKELQETVNKCIEAGLLPPDTTLDDIDVWDSPEYCLRKLITSLYGREDYLADCVSAIPAATTINPELPVVAASKERNKEEKDELPTVKDFCVRADKLVANWKEIEKQSKTEKRLWKARIVDTPNNNSSIYFIQKEYCTDVREMSVKEAVEWYKDLKEHLNDFESAYDSEARGLYYKRDGEWVRYNLDKEK